MGHDTSGHRLPAELLDMILNLVASDGANHLLPSSTLCSQWCARALPIFFRTIVSTLSLHRWDESQLTPETQARDLDMFLAILERYPGLGSSVITIEFCFGYERSQIGKEFFSNLLDALPTRCRRIRTLVIRHAEAAKAWRIGELLVKLQEFAQVERLELDSCMFRISDLRAFSSALPLLKHVDIGNRFVCGGRQSSWTSKKARTRREGESAAQSLRIICEIGFDQPDAFFDFLHDGPFRNITTLSFVLREMWEEPWPRIGIYVAHLGPALRHLELWGSYRSAVPWEDPPHRMDLVQDMGFDFSQNPSLQSLILGFDDMATSSLKDALKATALTSLRCVLWSAPQNDRDDLKAELSALAQILPSSVQELCVYNPVEA